MENTEKSKLINNTGISAKWSSVKGIAAMLAYTVFAATSRVCVQMLEKAVPDFELNAIRCAFTMGCLAVYFVATKTWPIVNRDNWISVGLLCIFNNVCSLTLFIAVTLISLSSVESVLVTCQVITSLVIFKLINKEKVTWDKLLAVPVCSTGVILVLQPTFIFRHQNGVEIQSSVTNYTDQFVDISDRDKKDNRLYSIIFGYTLSVIGGVSFNMVSSVTKYNSDFYTNKNIIISLIWTTLMGTIFSIIGMLILEEPGLPKDFSDIALVGGHAVTFALIMPLFCYGSLLISGSLGAIIRSLNLIFVLAAQYVLMKDILPGHRNWIEVLGVILVLFGAIFSSIVELVKETISENNAERI